MLNAELRKQYLLCDIYRKVIWHLQFFALWLADGQAFGRFVILCRCYFGGVILKLKAARVWEKCSVLGTEKPFNVFFSREGIRQDDAERERYKKTEGLHFVLSLNKGRLQSSLMRCFFPRAFSGLNTDLCLNDLLYHQTGTKFLFVT